MVIMTMVKNDYSRVIVLMMRIVRVMVKSSSSFDVNDDFEGDKDFSDDISLC